MDIKKLGRLPSGGGWRAHGRGSSQHKASRRAGTKIRGCDYVHSVVDWGHLPRAGAHSRLAYSEILPDEQAGTITTFWDRAHAWYAAMRQERAGPDRQQPRHRSGPLNALLDEHGVTRKYTRPWSVSTSRTVMPAAATSGSSAG